MVEKQKAAVMTLDLLELCLQTITNYSEFEQLCNDLMALHEYPDIEPLGGSSDSGRDALHYSREDGIRTVFAYSVRKDWRAKLREDCESIQKNNHFPGRIMFMCTSKISTPSRDAAVREVKERYGWDLRLYGLEGIRNLLVQHPEVKNLHTGLFSLDPSQDKNIVMQLGDLRVLVPPGRSVLEVTQALCKYQSSAGVGVLAEVSIDDSITTSMTPFQEMLQNTASDAPNLTERLVLPSKLLDLLGMVQDPEDRMKLFWFSSSLWLSSEGSIRGMILEVLTGIVDGDSELSKFLAIMEALEGGHPKDAMGTLNECSVETDPHLLQLRAQANLQLENPHKALADLRKAASIVNVPEFHQRTADLAYALGEIDIAVEQIKLQVELTPEDILAHRNLASLYFSELRDYASAAREFSIIHEADPDDQVVGLSLANTLVVLYRPKESLSVFDELCQYPEPMKPAILGRAQLLESMGKPQDAVISLLPFREAFKDDPDFLLVLMGIAFAAGEEEVAHSVLRALEDLRESGAKLEGKFERVQVNDGMGILKDRIAMVRERDNIIQREMLRGRIPIVMADGLVGEPFSKDWQIRTQPRSWISDIPEVRSHLVLYATNALHSRRTRTGRLLLLPIEVVDSYETILLDITSIITLWKLDLLELVAEQYDKVLIPEEYLATVLEDSRKMMLHQRSKADALSKIKEFLDDGRVLVDDDETESHPLVDEYDQEDSQYRMIDLVQPMHAAGVMTDGQLDLVRTIGPKDSGVDEEHPALQKRQSIVVTLNTLESLHSLGLLSAAVDFFGVHALQREADQVRDSLKEIRSLEASQKRHLNLWSFLRDDSRFSFVPHIVPDDMKREDDGPADYTAFIAYFIANDKGLPLLVDDRVIQRLALNENPSRPGAAFGTDILLRKLAADERIDTEKVADAMLQLMRWRYRFILPEAGFLVTLAGRYREHPPGQALMEVAAYVHDCMRDPGLFAYPEKTDIGEPMAMRLYLSWVTVVAEFLVGIWGNPEFSIYTAKELTSWSILELLPSTPQVLSGEGRRKLGALTARALLSHILIKSSSSPEMERMVEMMRNLKEEMHLSDEEYNTLVTEILDD